MIYIRREGDVIRPWRIGLQWFAGPQLHFRAATWKLRVGFCQWWPIWWFSRNATSPLSPA